ALQEFQGVASGPFGIQRVVAIPAFAPLCNDPGGPKYPQVTRHRGPPDTFDAVRDFPGAALALLRDYQQATATHAVSQGVEGQMCAHLPPITTMCADIIT